MKSMRVFAALVLLTTPVLSFASAAFTPVQVDDNGRIVIHGNRAFITRQFDGKAAALRQVHIQSSAGRNPGLFLSVYWDSSPSSTDTGSAHLIVIDATGKEIRRSNVLDSGLQFDWGDNNYVRFVGNAMYFGIYSPKRMQFIYRDGKLEENKGPWQGPPKPEIYIEPRGDDPCGNVNGVEDCRAEVAREKANRAVSRRQGSTVKRN